MELTKAQRNDIFRAVAAGRLDPAHCQMTVEKRGFDIRHDATGSLFIVVDRGFFAALLPGANAKGTYGVSIGIGRDPSTASAVHGFSGVLEALQSWAEAVVDWMATPDLWELGHNWKFLGEQQYEDSMNVPFSPEEQDAISSQFAAIRESVKKSYALTAEQEAKIDARFDEAEKAAKRLGRKDWILLFAGGIFSLILTDVITPDIAQHILMMATHGLEHLFTSAPRSIRAE